MTPNLSYPAKPTGFSTRRVLGILDPDRVGVNPNARIDQPIAKHHPELSLNPAH